MPRAEVVLSANGSRIRQMTAADGTFAFPASPSSGRLDIRASGFAAASVAIEGLGRPAVVTLRAVAPGEQVIVTAARGRTAVSDTAESVEVFSATRLQSEAALTLDDKLRQVPGFTLFRRSSSRASNPTAQGVSMRGAGASGASRALVLHDGIPLNDPFGGWVYWNRIPVATLEAVEVLRGGGSHLYGSGAMSGVIQLREVDPSESIWSAEGNFGSNDTPYGSAVVTKNFGALSAALAIEGHRSNGYFIVREPERGAVDIPANIRYASGGARLAYKADERLRLRGSGSVFNEGRDNGTLLQRNSTRLVDGSAGLEYTGERNRVEVRAFGSAQRFVQTFSAISQDRNQETLTRWDRVPSQQAGFSAVWQAAFSNHSPTAGADVRWVRGRADGIVYAAGTPASNNVLGGRQRIGGIFARDAWRVNSRVMFSGGARLDRWSNYAPFSLSRSLRSGQITDTPLAERTDTAFSPYAGVLVHAGAGVSLNASGYRAFRAPTLQELYRGFRVGNVLTLANEQLSAERLTGGQAGVLYEAGRGSLLRATFFWNEISDAVGNRTLSVTPALITRQRQNIGRTRASGIEVDIESRVSSAVLVNAGYQFVQSEIAEFSADASLVGKFLPQVPRHQATFSAAVTPRRWTFAVQARLSGRQFDDDQNLLPLDGYFTADAQIAKRLSAHTEVFIAAENLGGNRYMVGRTPVPTWGPPRQVRGGIRISSWR